ncbi:MAG: hypothetical protein ACTS2F_14135 [Thainema sp.]
MKHSTPGGLIRSGLISLFTGLLVTANLSCSSSPTLSTEQTDADNTITASSSEVAVARPHRSNIQPIAQLLAADPTTIVDTTVHLSGKIVQQIPLVDGRIYELQDETGSIWVMAASESEALITGNNIQIQGIVAYENIAIAGQEQGELYIQEQQIFD